MENLKKIRIGVCGYGNLGKGVEKEIINNPDMELVAIFEREDAKIVKTASNVSVINVSEVGLWKDKIDVMILCIGSARDLPIQGPKMADMFNTIDSFDTHASIPEYYNSVDIAARKEKHISIISVGWDPGLFSINRAMQESILPNGTSYTFWGKGVSQGHSEAIRQIKGVRNAIQYTIPNEKVIDDIRNGESPVLSAREKHLRECYVVLEPGASKEVIENEITNMPNYFADYDTTVNFITEEELRKNHSKMSHGGFVIRSGNTNKENKQIMEFSLKLDSNPEFTSSVLIAYARAAYRLSQKGEIGARTVLDIPPYLLSINSREELIKNIL